MNNFLQLLLSNKLEKLEDFKIKGDIKLKSSVLIDAMTEKEADKKEANKSKKKKTTRPSLDLDKEDYQSILENIQINTFNLSNSGGNISLEFDIEKK